MRRKSGEQPVSDINITPLTDVMMVLLVIFMISSPVLMAKGIEVHLPQVENPPSLVEEDHVLYVTSAGELFLDNRQYEIDALREEFVSIVEIADQENEAVNLFIHADQSVSYGDLTSLMSIATHAGIEQISLVQDVINQDIINQDVINQDVINGVEGDSVDVVPPEPNGSESATGPEDITDG